VIEPVTRTLHCSCEQAFDRASDIELYPEFLKWWISARVTNRDPPICCVEQEVGFGAIRLRFTSTAVLQRPVHILVTSTDAPFRCLNLSWTCTAISSGSCQIRVTASVELRSGLLQLVVNPFLAAGDGRRSHRPLSYGN
jgi:ribosome-associated toxin RatA of RatAB toxin-antitoxin module